MGASHTGDEVIERNSGIVRTLSWAPLAVTAVVVVFAATSLVDARSDVRDALVEQVRARDRAGAMIALRAALLDAETGQRGYLLTGDPDYLGPFEDGSARLEGVVKRAFDPALRLGLTEPESETRLRALIDDKMAELRETIALHDAGDREGALALVKTDRGRLDMDAIRATVETTIDAELGQREAAVARVEEARGRVTRTLTILLALMGVMLVWTMANAARARRTALAERSLVLSEQARERIETLAHELDHRMKNIFTVVSGLLRQTARGRSEEVRDYAEAMDGRLVSMSHAYSMTRQLGEARTMKKREIVDRVVRGQILAGHALSVDGPALTVNERAVTPLALVLHELTTNALKYGAWKSEVPPARSGVNDNAAGPDAPEDAGVRVAWSFEGNETFALTWHERAGPAPRGGEADEGFGSRLMRNCARQLGGGIEREWTEDGLRVTLRAPVTAVAA